MVKVVINGSYGPFCLPESVMERLIDMGMVLTEFDNDGTDYENKDADIVENARDCWVFKGRYSLIDEDDPKVRSDPRVVQAVEEEIQSKGGCGDIKVVEIPDDVAWAIEEYDGLEWVTEKHRTWGRWDDDTN